MSDLMLNWQDDAADLALEGGSLETDAGLQTAVILSLFTDRRAEPDDELPGDQADRRGWWADAYAQAAGDRIGSRLWLLAREKQLQSVVNRAREYAEEALQWLLEDSVATRVEVEAEVVRRGVLGLQVRIYRPRGTDFTGRYSYAWENI
ncbi:phage GP46 family protein [Alkalilimnicola sp. S0819]|uniref:phage GP46 family protein n=1 Tax=Alkalilimnicola sp. S0819 TaxID=2613922 RepID=UPI0012617260|nr:phage GP46 family protein [Alkalilimnicola sp. S0819]KAB7624314.1 hypothetical protein F3N43_05765 [Alkalilimnicola sp. S0819]MPQ16138.1 hypothetical protein [Alkalilimnicola sp. S0819]